MPIASVKSKTTSKLFVPILSNFKLKIPKDALKIVVRQQQKQTKHDKKFIYEITSL